MAIERPTGSAVVTGDASVWPVDDHGYFPSLLADRSLYIVDAPPVSAWLLAPSLASGDRRKTHVLDLYFDLTLRWRFGPQWKRAARPPVVAFEYLCATTGQNVADRKRFERLRTTLRGKYPEFAAMADEPVTEPERRWLERLFETPGPPVMTEKQHPIPLASPLPGVAEPAWFRNGISLATSVPPGLDAGPLATRSVLWPQDDASEARHVLLHVHRKAADAERIGSRLGTQLRWGVAVAATVQEQLRGRRETPGPVAMNVVATLDEFLLALRGDTLQELTEHVDKIGESFERDIRNIFYRFLTISSYNRAKDLVIYVTERKGLWIYGAYPGNDAADMVENFITKREIYRGDVIDKQTVGAFVESLPATVLATGKDPTFGDYHSLAFGNGGEHPTVADVFWAQPLVRMTYVDATSHPKHVELSPDYLASRTAESHEVFSLVAVKENRATLVNIYDTGEVDEYFRFGVDNGALSPESLIFQRQPKEAPALHAPEASTGITADEAVQIMGVSKTYLYQMVREGKIPVVSRVGNVQLLDRARVQQFERQRRPRQQ